MSLSKKALMIGIGSTIAVSGITTAIAVPLATNSSNSTNNNQSSNTISATSITKATNLEDLVKALKPSDIVVLNKQANDAVIKKNDNTSKQVEVVKNETYAFNLTTSQFDLTNEAKKRFPKQVRFRFELDQTNNISSKLNDGKIFLTIKAVVGDSEVGKTTVELNEFKKANTEVVKLLAEQDNKLVLDLTKVSDSSYKTIETLNELKGVSISTAQPVSQGVEYTPVVAEQNESKKQSGITELLQKLMAIDSSQLDIKKWSVQGIVKLERISLDDKKTNTNFYLTNANSSSILKLVSEDKQEVLVDQLIVTNLLATNINVVVNDIDEKENKDFVAEFIKEAITNGYKANNEKVSLEIKKSTNVVSTVLISPYIVEKKAKSDEIKANLVVSFGNGNNAKSYNLGLENDQKELKEAGFSFGVYLKKTDKKDKLLKANDLTNTSKLEDYFVTKNFSQGFNPTTTLGKDNTFTKVDIDSSNSLKDFLLGKAEKTEMVKTEPVQADMHHEVPISENWISFVTYTYKQTALEKKVLLTPVIDVIHLEVKQPELPAEVVPVKPDGVREGNA